LPAEHASSSASTRAATRLHDGRALVVGGYDERLAISGLALARQPGLS
jgi:hypothetical protein